MNKFITFSEERLPEEFGLGAIGGPQYNTTLSTNANGYEQRNVNWLYARAKYDIAPSIKTTKQLENLLLFFRAHKGKAIGFRFKDHNDCQGYKEFQMRSDGITKSFPLIKTYQLGNTRDVRLINKPVADSLRIFASDIPTPVQCDYTKGVVTFLQIPESGRNITASFLFDVQYALTSTFCRSLVKLIRKLPPSL